MVINFKEISWDKLNNISYLDFGYKLGISDITYVGTDMKCVYPHISKLYDCGLHVIVKIGQKYNCSPITLANILFINLHNLHGVCNLSNDIYRFTHEQIDTFTYISL